MRMSTTTRTWRMPLVGLAAWTVALGLSCDADNVDEMSVVQRDAALPLRSPPEVVRVPAPLPAAHCEIDVEGQGIVDIEEDYLPNVVRCENGAADLEALKAQAVAARSVAYYAIETSGGICDSQSCQVYSCGGEPSAIHRQAVEETSGQYLMFNGTLTYGFYVAGDASTAPPECIGVSGATEHWVTYNEGRSGTDVEQTELGFVHDPADGGYGQNRGCMSQNGAACLEDNNGYDYVDILRFYYGDDIVLVQGEAACVTPPATGGESSGGEPSDSSGGEPPSGETEATDDGPTDPSTGDEGPLPGGTAATTDGPFDDGEGTSPADGQSLPTTFGADDGDDGCACAAGGGAQGDTAWWLWLLVPLARLRRRTRQG